MDDETTVYQIGFAFLKRIESALDEARFLVEEYNKLLAGEPLQIVSGVFECETEQEARNSLEKDLGISTDSLPCLISYIDSNQRFRLVNRTGAEWFGWSAQEILGVEVEQVNSEWYRTLRPHMETALKGLMSLGMAPGAAMSFMITGTIYSAPSLIAIAAIVKARLLILYLSVGLIGGLTSGYLYQAIVNTQM